MTAIRRRGADWLLNGCALLALVYLLVPIVVIIVFSFNDPVGRFNFIWQEFSLDAWKHPFAVPGVGEALKNSLQIAAFSTLIATALGTLTALALVRYEFKGRSPINFFIFIPLATPEVVLGAALLSQFLNWGAPALGFATILIAHVMFNLSFVVITVRSRLIGFDRSLEEAAQDLGAPPVRTFFEVTLPIISPAVFSGWVLAFTLSLDDLVIASFTSGPGATTLPMKIYSQVRLGVTPEINAVCTILIAIVAIGVICASVVTKRREVQRERDERAAAATA